MHELAGFWDAWSGGSGRRDLNFMLAGEDYTLDSFRVREILDVPELAPLIQAPAFVKGAFHLRGRIIPVVDLHAKLGKGESPGPAGMKVLVVRLDCRELGLLVDEVCEACRFEGTDQLCQGEMEIFPCVNLEGNLGCEGGKSLIKIELEDLFSVEDLEMLQACLGDENRA
jgi:purine-binding chemotaxis protein CheW